MPRTVNRSADAAITSTQSSSEKSEFDNVSMFSSLCSLERSSFACIWSTRHRMDLKSAIIVCVSKSVQDIRWMTMCWVVDMNLCRVMSSIETTSASSRHLSNLRHVTYKHSQSITAASNTTQCCCVPSEPHFTYLFTACEQILVRSVTNCLPPYHHYQDF